MRRAQARRMPPSHGGTSATAKDVLYGEWDTRAAVGPALQWCRMLWNAQVNPTRSLIPFPELLQLWEQAKASDAGDWKSSRGPLARATLSARRAGWKVVSGTQWIDHWGCMVDISRTPPRLLLDILREGLQREAEFRLARRLGHAHGMSATFALVRGCMCTRTKLHTRQQQFLLLSCATDSIWTEARACDAGYLTDGMCACGRRDTLHHRLYTCELPDVVAARQSLEIPPAILEEGAHSDDPVFTRGLFVFSDKDVPPPSTSAHCEILDGAGGDLNMQPEELASLAGNVVQLEMAADGSCTKQALRCLHRASWAIALMKQGSESLLAVLRGVVPGGLPQSPAMAEHVAAALCGQVADRPTSLALDCKAVICQT